MAWLPDACGCLALLFLWIFYLADWTFHFVTCLFRTLWDWLCNRDRLREPFLPDEEAWESSDWSTHTLYPWDRREGEDDQSTPPPPEKG